MTEEHLEDDGRVGEADEVDEILLALKGLIQRATSPVVRLCLEEGQRLGAPFQFAAFKQQAELGGRR